MCLLAGATAAFSDFVLTSPSSRLYYTHGVLAGGRVQIAGGTRVVGDLHANGAVHLQNGSTVEGDVSAAGKVTNQGTVTGSVRELVSTLALPALQSDAELRALADRVLTGNQTLNNAIVDDVLFVQGDVRVTGALDGAGTIIATGRITLESGPTAPLEAKTRLSLIARGDIRIDKDRRFRGVLYAGRDIALQKGLQLQGVVVAGRDLSIDKDALLELLSPDAEAPLVTLVRPQDGAILDTATPTIEVRYTDGLSGIDVATARFLLDGTDRTAQATVGAAGLVFTPSSPLPDGLHAFEVTVGDNAGNEGGGAFTFTISTRPADTDPPVVVISSPPNGSTVQQSPVQVTGTVTDQSAITSMTVSGQVVAFSNGAFSASVALVDGDNTITVEAVDAAGNTGQATVTVRLARDETPPALTIVSPAAGSFVLEGRPVIEVTFSDDGGIDPASLSLKANNAPLAADCELTATGGRCTPTVALPENSVTLAASVSDTAGNTGSASVQFTVDTAGLEVAVTSPAGGTITREGEIQVAGTISDGVSHVRVNGVPAALSGGTFAVTVPLREGVNMLVALATKASGRTGSATVEVTRDLTAPIVRIDTPRNGFVAVTDLVTITGQVNDPVTGGVVPRVMVNSVEARVSNGAFVLVDVPLVRGPNTIEAVATDAVGNEGRNAINVTYQVPAGDRIVTASGDGQGGFVRQTLVQPLVAVVTDNLGNPVAGRMVRFAVTRNSGTLRAQASDEPERTVQVPTDGNGRASVLLTLGDTTGEGTNRVVATALGVAGEAEFCASAFPLPAQGILMSMGDNQRGVAGQPLPMPMIALVVDADGNPVPGVDVTFQVARGGGHLDGGPALVRRTGIDGQARAVLTLGLAPGINNNVVEATFAGSEGLPATFTASALAPGNPAETRFSGVVLDNAQTPIPGAEITIADTSLRAITDAQGQFLIEGVPVGHIHIHIHPEGSPRAETFAPLAFETVTVAGQNNTLGQPILLPALDMDNSKIVGGSQDVTLTMEGVEGLALTVFANSATFHDGSRMGRLVISQVHLDKVPMAPPGGAIFMAPTWTIQPHGTHFDPPARITIPNNGLVPGRVVDIYQFDHALNQFISIGKGTVSEDGATITSDPGFGITAAGWGGGAPPPPPPTCGASCDDGNPCTTDSCQNGSCVHAPAGDGGSCNDDGNRCTRDICQAGACVHPPRECNECQRCRNGNCETDPMRNRRQCMDEGNPECTVDRCQNGQCQHTPVPPIAPHDPDPYPLDTDNLNQATSDGLDCLRRAVTGAGGTFTVTSGYRPPSYQDHFREIAMKRDLLRGWSEAECADSIASVNREVARHGNIMIPARNSQHTVGNAFDAAFTLPAGQDIDQLAEDCGLTRPVPVRDPVHFVPR